MLKLPIWLIAIVVSLFLLFSWGTPAFASTFDTLHPRLAALRNQPPDSGDDTSSGTVNWVPNDQIQQDNQQNNPGADLASERQEIRAQSKARQESFINPAFSAFSPAPVPGLQEFVQTVRNNQPGIITGVYVDGRLALRVLPADPKDPLYVTIKPGAVTNSCGTQQCPSIGLLAHNLLSGALFSRLTSGQEADLVYGDGSIKRYRIVKIRHFQALAPTDPYSSFLDLDTGGPRQSSSDVFAQTFGLPNRLVLQTCITANGELTWGRLFVIAEPM